MNSLLTFAKVDLQKKSSFLRRLRREGPHEMPFLAIPHIENEKINIYNSIIIKSLLSNIYSSSIGLYNSHIVKLNNKKFSLLLTPKSPASNPSLHSTTSSKNKYRKNYITENLFSVDRI